MTNALSAFWKYLYTYGIKLMPFVGFPLKIIDFDTFVYKIKLSVVISLETTYNEIKVTNLQRAVNMCHASVYCNVFLSLSDTRQQRFTTYVPRPASFPKLSCKSSF